MLSLLGWACQYYSRNLPIPTFPWSACRVHLMSSLLRLAQLYTYYPHRRACLEFLGKLNYFVIKVS